MIKKELKKKIEDEVLFREVTDDEMLIINLCSDIITRHNRDNIDLEKEIYDLNVRIKNKNIEIDGLREELFNLKQKIKNEGNKR